jgi:eukaryotic-like serine/threonine-protein kinase
MNPPKSEAEQLVGTILSGKWTLDSLIGMGGMATVYAATHRNGRRAAIKILGADYSRIKEVRDRFLREGYVANQIDHPNVVAILDDDTTESGQTYLVMELLEGHSFLERINQRTLSHAEVVFIGEQVLLPLGVAHRRGIIHRDIKPGNVFVCRDGRVKVLDYGLARVLEGHDMEPTRDGLVLGTVPYMAPEQARAKRDAVDWRSDIYGVGAMLFYALSGRFVHQAKNQIDVLMATMKQPAPSLGSVAPNVPPKVVALVDKALMFNPAERWQCAEDMADAARIAFEELSGMSIPTTERTVTDGRKGWVCPAMGSGITQSATTEIDVVVDEGALTVSVVFEPEHSESLHIPIEIEG